ncbi:MAG TPA: sterol-binding protein [Burkholderiales bacterium]|nr:sterol-binding protein [Burkholderiales bacterium]
MAINRLLDSEPWARERLAPYAGQTVELRAGPFPALRFTILPGGRLEAGGESPTLVATWSFARPVELAGDEKLAAEVTLLARHLRWDFEEDLSRLVGDVAAHRLAEGARAFAAWPADAARRLGGALADYAVEEKRVLVGRAELDQFRAEIARLHEALERLDQRARRLG